MSVKMKEEALLKEQIKVIDELQEKIRLQKFDISKNLEIINSLKNRIERKNQIIAKAREELVMMQKEKKYSNISYVLRLLKEVNNDE